MRGELFIEAGKDRLEEGVFNQVEDSLPRVGLGVFHGV